MSSERPSDPEKWAANPLLRLTFWIVFAVALSFLFFGLLILGIQPQSKGTAGLPPGTPAPEVQAAGWLNGPPPDDLEGRVVLVEAWATWCRPCWEVAPEMVDLYDRYRDRGVVFIGLTDEGPEAMRKINTFLSRNGITWPNGYGAGQTLVSFDTMVIPSVWIIGRDGIIVWNEDSRESIEQALDDALAK